MNVYLKPIVELTYLFYLTFIVMPMSVVWFIWMVTLGAIGWILGFLVHPFIFSFKCGGEAHELMIIRLKRKQDNEQTETDR